MTSRTMRLSRPRDWLQQWIYVHEFERAQQAPTAGIGSAPLYPETEPAAGGRGAARGRLRRAERASAHRGAAFRLPRPQPAACQSVRC